MTGRYKTTEAFRSELEQRLLKQARESRRPLDRLRKEVAHHRLLARMVEVAPPGSWALRGGLALLERLDDLARATSNADTNWRAGSGTLEHTIDRASTIDLEDGFAFEIGQPQELRGETVDGRLRFPIVSFLAGREFERINLDVNIVPGDRRPTEDIQLRDLLGFAGISAPSVPN